MSREKIDHSDEGQCDSCRAWLPEDDLVAQADGGMLKKYCTPCLDKAEDPHQPEIY